MTVSASARLHRLADIDFATVSIGDHSIVWGFATIARSARIGARCTIGPYAKVDGVTIDDDSVIGSGASLPPGVVIGSRCFIGPNSTFCNDAWPRAHKEHFVTGPPVIIIQNGASIGAGAIVLPGVTVGEGAMIAAGAIVEQDVPAGCFLNRRAEARPIPRESRMVRGRMRPVSGTRV